MVAGRLPVYQTDAQTLGLWALKLSPTTGKAEGGPVPVLDAGSEFSASADGTLLWVDVAIVGHRRLTWRDRGGKKLADTGLPSATSRVSLTLSPDGIQAAYADEEQGNSRYLGCRSSAWSAYKADFWPGARLLSSMVALGSGDRFCVGTPGQLRDLRAGSQWRRRACGGLPLQRATQRLVAGWDDAAVYPNRSKNCSGSLVGEAEGGWDVRAAFGLAADAV